MFYFYLKLQFLFKTNIMALAKTYFILYIFVQNCILVVITIFAITVKLVIIK